MECCCRVSPVTEWRGTRSFGQIPPSSCCYRCYNVCFASISAYVISGNHSVLCPQCLAAHFGKMNFGLFVPLHRSLQKVQGHRAGVDVDVTPPTGVPVEHPPPIRRPCVTAVRREVNRNTQGHLQNTHDTGLVTISFPRAVCRTGPSDYQLWFMTCTREEDDRITYRHVPQDRLWMESSPH